MSLTVEGGSKQQKVLDRNNQEKRVERNFLQLRLAKMEKQLSDQVDILDDHQAHSIEFEFAISSRLIEIESQMKILKSKKKTLSEERSQMIADIAERTIKIEQLRIRFDLTQNLLGTNEDGVTTSAIEFKAQIDQEKMLLLLHADDLNQRIMKAENDDKLVLSTLKMMGFANNVYSSNVNSYNSEEGKKLFELKDKCNQNRMICKQLEAKTASLIDNAASFEVRSKDLEQELEATLLVKSQTKEALTKLRKSLLDQEVKLQRAERELETNMQAAKRKIVDQAILSTFEADCRAQEQAEASKMAQQKIADLAVSFQEMQECIERRCHDKAICLPKSIARLAQPQSFVTGIHRESQSQGSSGQCKFF